MVDKSPTFIKNISAVWTLSKAWGHVVTKPAENWVKIENDTNPTTRWLQYYRADWPFHLSDWLERRGTLNAMLAFRVVTEQVQSKSSESLLNFSKSKQLFLKV